MKYDMVVVADVIVVVVALGYVIAVAATNGIGAAGTAAFEIAICAAVGAFVNKLPEAGRSVSWT